MTDEVTEPDAAIESRRTTDREVLGWDQFGEAARSLVRDVLASGFDPEVVIAIARGGLLLGGAIAYALDIKACGALNVEFYTGVNARLPEPVVVPPMLDDTALDGKRVLLVDDVSDSGQALDLVVDLVQATSTPCSRSPPVRCARRARERCGR